MFIGSIPTGILALSSMTRYSHSPCRPERSTATMSKPICRLGTSPNRVGIEASKRVLLSMTSSGTTSSLPASRPLRQPPLQHSPVRSRQDAWHVVGGMDLLVRDHAQLSLLLEPPPLCHVGPPPPLRRAHPPHLLEHGPVVRKRLASRAEDLVGGRQIALEA